MSGVICTISDFYYFPEDLLALEEDYKDYDKPGVFLRRILSDVLTYTIHIVYTMSTYINRNDIEKLRL